MFAAAFRKSAIALREAGREARGRARERLRVGEIDARAGLHRLLAHAHDDRAAVTRVWPALDPAAALEPVDHGRDGTRS